MTNRVHIDAPAGIVEIEGEKEFVEGLLSKVFPLLEAAGFGSRPPSTANDFTSDPRETSPAEEASADDGAKTTTRKRRVNAPPKGHSCAARMLTLKGQGFFKTHRTTGEIVEGLKGKGWTHAPNQVAAGLTSLFNRQEIQRTKEGSGSWKYFWDRD